MADFINNIAASDAYTPACTIDPDFRGRSVVITVANNPALFQVATGTVGNYAWSDEREYFSIPQSFKIGNVIGIRFRNAVAGQTARILATLTNDDDPQFESGVPFTGTLSAQGGISSDVIVPTVALASFPPANPQDGQIVSLVLPSAFDPIGGKAIRWLCQYDASLAMWDVDGADLVSQVDTAEATASTLYTGLATPGPSGVLPRPGDYIFIEDGLISSTLNGQRSRMSYALGGVGAIDADNLQLAQVPGTNGLEASLSRGRFKTGLAAITVLAQYRSDAAGNSTFANRGLRIRPVRIT